MGNKSSRGDRLSKEDLEFLRSNTRYDEGTINEWYKGFKQDCPDGKLTPDAFMKIYSKCFPAGSAGQFCDHVFRTFDSDKNGFVDFKEFLLAIDVTSSGTPEEKLNWAFRYIFEWLRTAGKECDKNCESSKQMSLQKCSRKYPNVTIDWLLVIDEEKHISIKIDVSKKISLPTIFSRKADMTKRV